MRLLRLPLSVPAPLPLGLRAGRQMARRVPLLPPHQPRLLPRAGICTSLAPASAASAPSSSPSSSGSSSSSPPPEEEEEEASHRPRTVKERLKFLSKRYGWWSLFVYLLLSAVDLSATFALVHFYGADHIRRFEQSARERLGFGKRDTAEEQTAAEQVGDVGQLLGLPGEKQPLALSNSPARAEVLHSIQQQQQQQQQQAGAVSSSHAALNHPASCDTSSKKATGKDQDKGNGIDSALWAEFVLAYTIHKTLLLPLRVMATAAVLPSFVRLMVRWGLAKPAAQVRHAAVKGNAASAAAAAAGRDASP